MGARLLLTSHDGYGLGHTRRNARIAQALLTADPTCEVVLYTGIASDHSWLHHPRLRLERVPSLAKDDQGVYTNTELGAALAHSTRTERFTEVVRSWEPDAVLVDRHPFGIADELLPGLTIARRRGTPLLLGMRDVLDDAAAVRHELGRAAWRRAPRFYTSAFVYGQASFCDHQREYGLRLPVEYCGWVVDVPPPADVEPGLLVVTAGGGGDGADVAALGCALASHPRLRRTVVVAGPAAQRRLDRRRPPRTELVAAVDDCAPLYARADASLQMAGYNSTLEALAAGLRPLLAPRRSPRREQAIRASRLMALGLADVVDAGAAPHEVGWFLDQPRRLDPGAVGLAGLSLDGAPTAARRMLALAGAPTRTVGRALAGAAVG